MTQPIRRRKRSGIVRHLSFPAIGIFLCAAMALSGTAQQAPPPTSSSTASNSSKTSNQSGSGAQSTSHDDMQGMAGMPGMKMDHGQMSSDQMAERDANGQMIPGHQHMGPHMKMSAKRPSTPEDWAKADEVVTELREGIEKYKDYKVALADGFEPFLPNLPQPMYHFTSARNGFLESFTFDASRPTSLLYKKTASGYELIGAMYTMPVRATEEELNERIPLSIAQWHLHTNLCMPKVGQVQHADFTKFGLMGSITTKASCDANGGRFYPILFGWMVHVYPFKPTKEKIWEQ
jgi:hypothetical protein